MKTTDKASFESNYCKFGSVLFLVRLVLIQLVLAGLYNTPVVALLILITFECGFLGLLIYRTIRFVYLKNFAIFGA